VYLLDRSAAHDFAGALRIFDMHPEERFYDEMKATTGKAAQARLGLVQDGPGQPA